MKHHRYSVVGFFMATLILTSCDSTGTNEMLLGSAQRSGVSANKSGVFSGISFVVNTSDDLVDGTCDASHCSLREAIQAANASPGADRIQFDIPGSGPHVIAPVSGVLPEITDQVNIDASTATVILDGANVNGKVCSPQGAGVLREFPGLDFIAGSAESVVQGLTIRDFCIGIAVTAVDGLTFLENTFEDNVGNASLDFWQANANRAEKNSFVQNQQKGDQIELYQSNSNVIIDNIINGGEDGIELLFSHNNVVAGNQMEHQFRDGMLLFEATQNTLENNEIRSVDFGFGGIIMFSANQNTIENNEINEVSSFLGGIGVLRSKSNAILRNTIHNNNAHGIILSLDFSPSFSMSSDNRFEANVIYQNTGTGLLVGGLDPNTSPPDNGVNNTLTQNVVYANGGIGIDLTDEVSGIHLPDGPTANDSGLGANRGQNYPILDESRSKWHKRTVLLKGMIGGALGVAPLTKYRVECFANATGDREARVFLGSKVIPTDLDAKGNVVIPLRVKGALWDGEGGGASSAYFTCTATDPEGNTSELSPPILLNKEAV